MMLAFLFAVLQQYLAPQVQTEPHSALDLAMEAHLAVARAERELEFFARYDKAGEAARARARNVLERLRSPGSASGSPSSIFAVAKATRALETPALAEADEARKHALERLTELVDALDLQPAPGIFDADAAVQGQLARVVVYPLYPPAERLQATLSLWWTQPDGKELLGYHGLAKPAVFEAQGFSVELGAPGNAAGSWSLSIELEYEGLRVRSLPLEIPCVPQLAKRTSALFAGLDDRADPRQPLARWIALASQRGMRTLARVSLDDQLARLEGQPRAGSPYPWCLAFVSENGDSQFVWRVDGSGDRRKTLLLLCPSAEPTEAILSRAGWAWPGYRVLSTHLPRGGGGEGSAKELFERLRKALALEGDSDGTLIVVARGDAIGRMAMGFYGASTRPYDAEVFSMSTAPANAQSLEGGLPRLVFAPGGHAGSADSQTGSMTWWLDASAIPLIADFDLPRRLRGSIGVLLTAGHDAQQEKK